MSRGNCTPNLNFLPFSCFTYKTAPHKQYDAICWPVTFDFNISYHIIHHIISLSYHILRGQHSNITWPYSYKLRRSSRISSVRSSDLWSLDMDITSGVMLHTSLLWNCTPNYSFLEASVASYKSGRDVDLLTLQMMFSSEEYLTLHRSLDQESAAKLVHTFFYIINND